MSNLNLFVPIRKIDEAQRLVYGVATAESADRSGEICDYASTKPLYETWSGDIAKSTDGKSLGNLRAMHGKVAAGKVSSIAFNDAEKQIEICAKVVDDNEWKKVVEGVYTGFSQGGAYVKRWTDPENSDLTRYTANPTEISLVDLPCLPGATFSVVKADGAEELRKFVEPEAAPVLADLEQVWKARDGKTFAKKAEAIAHNAETEAAESAQKVAGGALAALDKAEQAAGMNKAAKEPEAAAVIKDAGQTAATPDLAGHDAMSAKHRAASKGFQKDASDYAADGNAKKAGESRDAARAHDDAADLHDRAGKLQASKSADADKASKDAYAATDAADAKTGTACKAVVAESLAKGLPTVAEFAYLIERLKFISAAVHMEAKQENDDSPVPEQLRGNIDALIQTFIAMATEEATELSQGQNVDDLNNVPNVFNMAADLPKDRLTALVKFFGDNATLAKFAPALEKAGARISAESKLSIQKAHDALILVGAVCDGANLDEHTTTGEINTKAHDHGDMEKAAMQKAMDLITPRIEALGKTVEAQAKTMAEQAEKIAALELQPVPAPMLDGTRAVSKAGDNAGTFEAEFAKMTPEEQQRALFKIAQQKPINIMDRG